MQMFAQRVVDLEINIFGKDLFTTCLTDGKLEFRNGEGVQSAIVTNFGVVLGGRDDDFRFTATTASSRKRSFQAWRIFCFYRWLREHEY